MSEKPTPRLRMAPLQTVKAGPITDPAELAAIDEVRRRARTVTAGLISLYQQLPPPERAPLIARLAAELPDETQLEFLGELVAELPQDAVAAVEAELQTRLAQPSG